MIVVLAPCHLSTLYRAQQQGMAIVEQISNLSLMGSITR